MDLRVNETELASCVQCGLCLSSCPTYRVTGDETMSPRGRIALMRQVHLHDAPVTAEVLESFETCIQCRGCEPACPSVVPYGHLIEATRGALVDAGTVRRGRPTRRLRRLGLGVLARPRLLRVGSSMLALAQRARLIPPPAARRLALPERLPVRRTPLRASGSDVYLFTGCVMDAWQRDVHHATQRVLEAAGFGVTPTGDAAPCCGALHLHAGLASDGVGLATAVAAGLEPGIPIVVDSAGCGAHLKEHAGREVYDAAEFLAAHPDRLARIAADVAVLDLVVAVQDPCHLRHVQRVHTATRTVLAPFVRAIAELDDDGLCCGAGGAYSVLEPDMARQVRDRKTASIARVAPDVVASANPGCSMHLAAAPEMTVAVRHPMELIAAALDGNERILSH
jgi:glycolate oxidase iron-sulfur subunit